MFSWVEKKTIEWSHAVLFFSLLLRPSRSFTEAGVPLLGAWFFPLPPSTWWFCSCSSFGGGGGGWCLALGFQLLRGRGNSTGGDFTSSWLSRLWSEAQCGLGPAADPRPHPPGPCFPGQPMLLTDPPAVPGAAALGSGRTLLLRRGLLPSPPLPCHLCHRCCGSRSSPDAFGAQPPHQGLRSWAPLPSLVLPSSFKQPLDTDVQEPVTPRPTTPGCQSLVGLATSVVCLYFGGSVLANR